MWRRAMGKEPPDPPAPVRLAARAPGPAKWSASRTPKPTLPGDIDPHDAKAIRRGRIAVEARVDLHGMTQTNAHAALVRFLRRSAAAGLRCVLVITGKGNAGRRDEDESPFAGFGAGVLRLSLPRWLEAPELAPLVIASAPAAPRHGGTGARYVLLRRPRKSN